MSRKPKLKVDDATIEQICDLLAFTDYSRAKIAEMTGTTVDFVHSVRSGNVRSDISQKYDFDPTIRKGRKCSADDIKSMIDDISNGMSLRSVADKYGVSKNTVQRIKTGLTYKECVPDTISINEPVFNDDSTEPYIYNGESTNLVVTRDGRLFNTNTRKETKPNKITGMVSVKRKDGTRFTKSMDRIMGETFLSISLDDSIEHIDGDADNYDISNLKVISRRDKIVNTRNKHSKT